MQDEIRALVERHCHTLTEELKAVETCLADLENSSSFGASLNEGIELTHKIKGSSGSLGFPDVSSASAELEQCLKSLTQEQGDELKPDQMASVTTRLNRLQSLVSDLKPEDSLLFNAQFPSS